MNDIKLVAAKPIDMCGKAHTCPPDDDIKRMDSYAFSLPPSAASVLVEAGLAHPATKDDENALRRLSVLSRAFYSDNAPSLPDDDIVDTIPIVASAKYSQDLLEILILDAIELGTKKSLVGALVKAGIDHKALKSNADRADALKAYLDEMGA